MSLTTIHNKLLEGKRLTRKDGLELFTSHDLLALGRMATHVARQKNGNRVHFVQNMHINPTNICVNRCKFCAFSRSRGEAGAYEMTIPDILAKARTAGKGVRELHIVSGLHPDLPFAWYLEMLRALKKEFPKLHLKAFTAVEIDYLAKLAGLGSERDAAAAEGSRAGLAPWRRRRDLRRSSAEHALRREDHRTPLARGDRDSTQGIGLKSNATMLYGHIETPEHRIDHLLKLRQLQDRTGGFQAFIPLSFHSQNTEIKKVGIYDGVR